METIWGAGKTQPIQPNPWGLLLPRGCYKDCQKQWKYEIQTDCLFPCTHENHSSSIINALGLICQDFHKNEFKTKKISSIFMINAGKSVGWEIRLHTVLLPSKSLLTILDYFKSKQGEKNEPFKASVNKQRPLTSRPLSSIYATFIFSFIWKCSAFSPPTLLLLLLTLLPIQTVIYLPFPFLFSIQDESILLSVIYLGLQ